MKRNLSRPWTRWPKLHRVAAVAVVLGTLGGGIGLHVSAADAAPPRMCDAKPTFFDNQLKVMYEAWGGTGGQLGCVLSSARITDDGKAVFMEFRGGSMYWLNQDIPPTVVLGQVRDKWYAMGGGSSVLGYPRSHSFALFTPDGELGMANEFEGGAIYFAASTGAHEVHGSIAAHHKENFAELGFPTSDELDFTEGGKVSYFQHGTLYWWADTGVIHVPRNVVVTYSGFVAYREMDWDQATSSDEVIATVAGITPRTHATRQSPERTGIDSGDAVAESIELYRGAPEGITLTVLLTEHDRGDPNVYKREIEAGVAKVADEIIKGVGSVPVIGPLAATLGGPRLRKAVPAVATFVNDLFGFGDDVIGTDTIHVSAKDMVKMSARSNSRDHGVKWKVRSQLMTAGGSEYRAFFSVWNEGA